MLGPTGLGILYGKKELLEKMEPVNLGGGMNDTFDSNHNVIYKELPYKLEAGTMNISSVIAFSESIKYLEKMGMDNINKYEHELREYLVNKLEEIDNVTIYNKNIDSGLVLFNIDNIFSEDTSHYLNYYHIAVRSGNHCAKMVKDELIIKNTCRISLYFYNTKEEVDKFIEIMKGNKDIFKVIL